jgi:DNA-directed RNA polymerase subunit RPC12/RpoP
MRNNRYANEVMRLVREDAQIRRHDGILSDKERTIDNHRTKIEITARVLYECLMKMGVTREEIERKMQEIEERGWTVNPPGHYRICPECGKKVFDYTDATFEGTCMYCGKRVYMYPGDITE